MMTEYYLTSDAVPGYVPGTGLREYRLITLEEGETLETARSLQYIGCDAVEALRLCDEANRTERQAYDEAIQATGCP